MSALPEHLEHFRRRALYDALLEASTGYWTRRADTFAAVGNQACDQVALACRRHAALLAETGLDAEATAVINDILETPAGVSA